MPDLTYEAGSGQLSAYLAVPRTPAPWPGVVVIQDALGLTDDIREQADRLAAAGYLALAPSLYSGRGIRCVIATLQASRSGAGAAYEDIDAAHRWLQGHDDCTGRVGIIGFCMGGGFALLSAPRFDAAAVNYGEVPTDATERLVGACPIVGSYGGRDRTLPGRAERLRAALAELGVPHDVKEYPDAGHSFLNRIAVGPGFDQVLKFTGFNYHHPSAEDAWRRILAFFDEHLARVSEAQV
ncbi:MAG: dienelactone hydrolase family protein [Solirubrobacteraceae bacterium]